MSTIIHQDPTILDDDASLRDSIWKMGGDDFFTNLLVTNVGAPLRRFVTLGLGSVSLPAAGADVDGVGCGWNGAGGTTPNAAKLAIPGLPFRVEAGGAFASGALLDTDSQGRAVAHTSGIAVARAMEASAGAGTFVWAKFTSGR